MIIITTLHFKDEKKHSIRYDTDEDDAAVQTIYIMKKAMDKPWPKVITVSIAEIDA